MVNCALLPFQIRILLHFTAERCSATHVVAVLSTALLALWQSLSPHYHLVLLLDSLAYPQSAQGLRISGLRCGKPIRGGRPCAIIFLRCLPSCSMAEADDKGLSRFKIPALTSNYSG
ncbi:hypothetical protein AOQ84DRAFT_39436 [Glonium stellatum]|uniref:Uncharacterized protein n=1 Tax=Glonium stellatum TaxID=574774 RepID=A0A8E2F114_9PEZI|nr:hypothetical protein AOQ84DRAFT_39436 [Glonium stellatum]